MDQCDFLNPIIVISRLFGLATFTLVPNKITGTKVCKLSKFWLIYTIIFILIQIILQISVAFKTNFESNEVVLTKVGDYASEINLTSVVVIEIITFYNSKKLITVLNKMTLINLRNVTNENKESVMKCVSFASTTFIMLTILFSAIFLYYGSKYQPSINISFSVLFITKFTSLVLPEIQCITFFTVLKYKFQLLNSNLISTKHLYKNFDHNVNKRKFTKLLSSIHCLLCDLAEELNCIHHAQITISISVDFIEFTMTLFTDFRMVLFHSMNESTIYQYGSVVWVSLIALKLVVLLWVCGLVSFEVSRKHIN
ncbi:hypothetical protein L9F63_022107, partial [Diploptera punctata]